METIAVIDYGMGNLHSAVKALQHVANDRNIHVKVVNNKADLANAHRVVFPGVGAIGYCMMELQKLDLVDAIKDAIANKPVLAICVGMQALLEFSEENDGVACLGVLPGQVKHFLPVFEQQQLLPALKIPHMGWNQVTQVKSHPMWQAIPQDSRFYFVHSYFVELSASEQVVGQTDYGVAFTAAAAIDNLFAVQFHPEKSQHAGLQLLSNFIHWNGEVSAIENV